MEGSYLDIDLTAKYGSQMLSIIEKMTNGEVGVLIKVEDDKYIRLSKDEYANVCKELNDQV